MIRFKLDIGITFQGLGVKTEARVRVTVHIKISLQPSEVRGLSKKQKGSGKSPGHI